MNTKQLIVFLLVALFAVAAVSAQIDEQADIKLTDFLKAILKQQKAPKFQEEADLVFSPALVKRLLHTPAYYILTDEELADKSFWKKALKVVGEIGKAAIKDYVNKNWDEIPEEEADIKLGKLFKAVLPYLKEGAKQYINNNWDAEEMADKKFSEIIKSVLPYIKAGVKSYIVNNWDEEADKGFWSSVWKVVKGGVKDYVNKNWEQEMEMSDKFFSKVWKVVKDIGKGAIKSYVNQNFGVSADAQKFKLGNLWKKALPYIKSGVKEYLNKNWEQEVEMSDKIKFGKIFKKALNVAKGLGKAYITSQFGIPLEDLPQSDKFFKKMWSVVRTELKNAGKNYLKNLLSKKAAFAEEADAELKFKDILRKALPYLKEGAKQYINNNWDAEEAADKIDFEKLFRIALPYLRRQVE